MPAPRGMASQHLRTFERAVSQKKIPVPVNIELLTGTVSSFFDFFHHFITGVALKCNKMKILWGYGGKPSKKSGKKMLKCAENHPIFGQYPKFCLCYAP